MIHARVTLLSLCSTECWSWNTRFWYFIYFKVKKQWIKCALWTILSSSRPWTHHFCAVTSLLKTPVLSPLKPLPQLLPFEWPMSMQMSQCLLLACQVGTSVWICLPFWLCHINAKLLLQLSVAYFADTGDWAIVPVSWFSWEEKARLFCSLRCLFLHLAVTTCKCCVHLHSGFEMDVLHSPSKALAARHVCVCAVVELLHSVQINGGSRQADRQPFTSPACNCATRAKKKKMKKREKGRECTCWDKSFRCCFSSSFLISFKGKFCVCVWPALAWDSCFCFCFFLRASNTAWKPWGLKSNKTLLSHKLNASSLNSSDNFRK